MEMSRENLDWQRQGPMPWLESREGRLVDHPPRGPLRRLCCLHHDLEDVEEEFKTVMHIVVELEKFQTNDGREWYFPEEIWERIMKKALFQDLLCWRRVCKRWNLAIVTEKWTSEENRPAVPLMMRCRESSTADVAILALTPDYQQWFKMDIGRALTFLHLYCRGGTKCSPCIQTTSIASIGLLILTCSCSIHWDSDPCLVICNPVTMKVKPIIVPLLPAEYMVQSKGHFRLAGVIEGTNDRHYKLLFSTVYPNFVESFKVYCVYDSKDSSWKFGRGPDLNLPCILSKVSCARCFYFLQRKNVYAFAPGFGRKRLAEPRMSKYDAETDTWSTIAWLPRQEEGAAYLPQLVEFGGEVMFVGRRNCRDQPRGGPYHTWVFYKLDESALPPLKLWDYVPDSCNGSMPYALVGSSTVILQSYEVANWFRQDTRCEAHGDMVFFYNVQPCTDHDVEPSSSSESSTGMREVETGGVLLFDRKTGTWLSLPKYYPFQRADQSIAGMYKLEFFRPSLIEP